jgi:flagellar basal-body rod protein FlgG
MQEMVQLVQTMRHFESMQKVALGYDEMLGSAIRRLGETS